MDFSAAEKARGVKFCMHVGLLSGQVFSPLGEDWLAGSHRGGGITSHIMRCCYEILFRWVMPIPRHKYWSQRQRWVGIRNWWRRRPLRPYGGVCVLQACWRTCFNIGVVFLLEYGDVDSIMENCSTFSLIGMHYLLSARAWQQNFDPKNLLVL